jgi:DNA repair protein RadD
MTAPVLRVYQTKAVEDILDYAIANPHGRLLAVAPPAAGKTIVLAAFLRLAVDAGLKVLVVAHRREIVNQTYKHIVESGLPPEMVGVIMAADKRTRPEAPVQVASIDTLKRRDKSPFDVVVTDEAHRDASNTRRKLRRFYRDTFRLGFTASPCRMDGRGLIDDYDDLLAIAQYGELIAGGWYVAPRIFTVPERLLPNLRGVRVIAGEYAAGRALDRAMMKRGLIGNIISHWMQRTKDVSTVIFASSIKHSKAIVKAFTNAGVSARHIDQGTPERVRADILREFENGTILVLSCVNILAEGWDCPRCKCVVMARPTRSLNLHLQQSGRCVRPWNDARPIILDHAGNTVAHHLPYLDRDWKLENARGSGPGAENAAPVRICEACQAILPAGLVACTECGAEFPRIDVPEEKAGELAEYLPNHHELVADRDRIRAFATRKGFSIEWADLVFTKKYDHIPNIQRAL